MIKSITPAKAPEGKTNRRKTPSTKEIGGSMGGPAAVSRKRVQAKPKRPVGLGLGSMKRQAGLGLGSQKHSVVQPKPLDKRPPVAGPSKPKRSPERANVFYTNDAAMLRWKESCPVSSNVISNRFNGFSKPMLCEGLFEDMDFINGMSEAFIGSGLDLSDLMISVIREDSITELSIEQKSSGAVPSEYVPPVTVDDEPHSGAEDIDGFDML